MIEIGPHNAISYVRDCGLISPAEQPQVQQLSGGVSNVVLRIIRPHAADLVLKQSRRQLRTEAEWFSRLDRIWREADVMRVLTERLPAGTVPRILFEDRENYLFAMEAAPIDHVVWKAELLQGRADAMVAAHCGNILAGVHRETSHRDELRGKLQDRTVFDELRIDPFYRRVAAAHPDLTVPVQRLIDEMLATELCVVHADFSPKNILLIRDAAGELKHVTLVDFETGHYGDPAFDLGFFLSHLLLKTACFREQSDRYLELIRRFWMEYQTQRGPEDETGPASFAALNGRAVKHLAGCMLARIDGKSTVDYLPHAQQHDFVRSFTRDLFLIDVPGVDAAVDVFESRLRGR